MESWTISQVNQTVPSFVQNGSLECDHLPSSTCPAALFVFVQTLQFRVSEFTWILECYQSQTITTLLQLTTSKRTLSWQIILLTCSRPTEQLADGVYYDSTRHTQRCKKKKRKISKGINNSLAFAQLFWSRLLF